MFSHLRIARHTASITRIKQFYIERLGFKEIGSFSDHNGYNGIFLAIDNCNWHLEFTESEDLPSRIHDEDDYIVLYTPSKAEYDDIIHRLGDVKYIQAKNQYWNQNGKVFLDPDGNPIIVCHRNWSNKI